jgi:CheY-like chemotaxis protein
MPKGGKLIVTTLNGALDADYAAEHEDVVPGDYALIEVSDTGTGMPPEVVSRIFEPFFTTKERGKGTGLGLAMVFGFMKQSGGHINVYSEIGAGTTFRLYLPRTKVEAADISQRAVALPVSGRGETVLVVEDNESMRKVVVRQLNELGYHVLQAASAAAGLETLSGDGKVDLLFTDIVMPGKMDGMELARKANQRWPSLKIVLTSGFPENKLDGQKELIAGIRLLSKPYRKEDLARTIRETLDTSVPAETSSLKLLAHR